MDCKSFEMVVLGNTNTGKSTLINAIVNRNILNTQNQRETQCIWRISYSRDTYSMFKMVVSYKDISGSVTSEETVASCETFKELMTSIKKYSAGNFNY
jgi:septin family protein